MMSVLLFWRFPTADSVEAHLSSGFSRPKSLLVRNIVPKSASRDIQPVMTSCHRKGSKTSAGIDRTTCQDDIRRSSVDAVGVWRCATHSGLATSSSCPQPPPQPSPTASYSTHSSPSCIRDYKMRKRSQVMARSKAKRTNAPATRSKQSVKKKIQQQRAKKQKLIDRIHPRPEPLITVQTLGSAIQKAKRQRWKAIAEETMQIALGNGQYVEERRVSVTSPITQSPEQGPSVAPAATVDRSRSTSPSNVVLVAHDIFAQIEVSRQGTTFYPHYSAALAQWASSPSRTPVPVPPGTLIEFSRSSTLTAAHRVASALEGSCAGTLAHPSIGILSYASSKRPGGGFLHGGDEQEETIARLTTLVASLSSPSAQGFYQEHLKSKNLDGSGLHDHSIVYSPSVVVFRADTDDDCDAPLEDAVGGNFIAPFAVNVVSATPVNAAAVRAKHTIQPWEREFFEQGIRSAMKERMARVLRAFETHDNRTLVLGAFGSGSNENNVETIGAIWAELLVCGDQEGTQNARYKNVFDRVVFAVPGKYHEPFKRGFEMRVLEAEVAAAALSD